jgi:hypothetical protein
MTKTQYGVLAGVAGAAFATWWYTFRTPVAATPAHDRGETIFRNTPQPTENDALGG